MKLQPNFSWQKYEGAEEDQKQQFQFQLQQQHIQVSNSVNATIDDESFFANERMTSFTWTDGKAIWKKTVTGTIAAPGVTNVPHGITGIKTVVQIMGSAQSTSPFSTAALTLPHVDPNLLANGLGLYMDATNVIVNAGNATWNGYLFSATIYFTKK